MIVRASVVFPEPDSPTSARHSCGLSSSEAPYKTCCEPWNASTSSTTRSASEIGPGPFSSPSTSLIAGRSTSSARKQETRCRGSSSTMGGSPSPHDGSTSGQRGAKTQPGGRRPGAGMCPGMAWAAPARDVEDRRDQPRVYGVPGAYEHPLRRSELDDPPGVHNGDAVRRAPDRREVVADVDGADLVLPPKSRTIQARALGRDVETGRQLVSTIACGRRRTPSPGRRAAAALRTAGAGSGAASPGVGRQPYLLAASRRPARLGSPGRCAANTSASWVAIGMAEVERRRRVLRHVGDEPAAQEPRTWPRREPGCPRRRCEHGPPGSVCRALAWPSEREVRRSSSPSRIRRRARGLPTIDREGGTVGDLPGRREADPELQSPASPERPQGRSSPGPLPADRHRQSPGRALRP